MGTHAALAERTGVRLDGNLVMGDAVVRGTGNHVLANTGQKVVLASDDLTVVVTDSTVFVGDRSTDMKALVEDVARRAPEII